MSDKRHYTLRIVHYALCASIVLSAVALRLWVVQIVTIGSDSCQPAMRAGDRVAVMLQAYRSTPPQIGDWVAFTDACNGDDLYVGCISALPSDTLWIDMHGQPGSPDDACDLVVIPHARQRLEIDLQNIRLFDRAINENEPVKSAIIDDRLYISGKAANSYRFTHDYYWISSGDSCSDSRTLGLIPAVRIRGRVSNVIYSHSPKEPLYTGWSAYRSIY